MQKIKLRIIFTAMLFLSFFILIQNSQAATTYYVSPTGSDANAGTQAAPFKTIQKAANIVNPGDTVIVKDGTYTDLDGDTYIVKLTRGGSLEGGYVTFRAENTWGAVLDGQNTTKFGFELWATGTAAPSYIRIEGFEIKNVLSGAINGNFPATAPYQHDIYIYNNKLHDVGRVVRSCPSGVCEGECHTGHSGIGIHDLSYGLIVDSNLIYNIGRLPGGCSDQSDHSYDHGMYVGAQGTIVKNNIFYGNSSGWSVTVAGNHTEHSDGWRIVNNTFYGANPSKNGQIVLTRYTDDILIQNNISYGSLNYFIMASLTVAGKTNINIKNNLIYGAAISDVSNAEFHLLNNITGQDPKFVNLTSRDFHLQSISPAIGKGLLTNAPLKDFDGVVRGSSIDLGAYEYVPPGGDTTPPAIPAGFKVL